MHRDGLLRLDRQIFLNGVYCPTFVDEAYNHDPSSSRDAHIGALKSISIACWRGTTLSDTASRRMDRPNITSFTSPHTRSDCSEVTPQRESDLILSLFERPAICLEASFQLLSARTVVICVLNTVLKLVNPMSELPQ